MTPRLVAMAPVLIALGLAACQAHRPVGAGDLTPALQVRAELAQPRFVPGVDQAVTRLDGVVRVVTSDSVWVAPTAARTVTGAVISPNAQEAVALPRDGTVRLTSSRASPRRTWMLVGGLVVGVVLLVQAAGGGGGGGGVGY